MNSADQAIIFFVKEPVPGQIKTRLFADCGDDFAVQFYLACLKDVRDLISQCPGRKTFIYYFSPETPRRLRQIFPGCPLYPQSGADLGERMAGAFEDVFARGFSKAVLIGSDAPQITADIVQQAFDALNTHDAVLGPARDGGYYLIGLNQSCPGLFKGIRWSRENVLKETLQRARASAMQAAQLPFLMDIDTAADLKEIREKIQGWPADRARHLRAFLRLRKIMVYCLILAQSVQVIMK
ncbi:MAG: TIGR04282 family arsenosugar biosynthesis glycosyltransferase [Candidatus Omnitrophota bacterium]